ncbi:hypothetical protein [Desulfosporosinus sp. FKB]|uniref:hypothetical protein n=1 Tax=Desulfosporosinus sp. FKB TaxID=1969835 RepID=UPI000B4A2B65|nr:hypothetical protein [Desulfosporosinus sp. FKB]
MGSIIDSFCLWCDLLGYSTPFIDTKWDLNTEASERNFKRIEKLQLEFTNIDNYHVERVLVLNDGFARTIDLVYGSRSPQQYLYWFDAVLSNYFLLNKIDKADSNPGARAVLTFGQRYHYMKSNMTAAEVVQTSEERKKELEKQIVVYSPREFQMNTAFSKAYIIEGVGTKVGIKGSNIYIDNEFLKHLGAILTEAEDAAYFFIDDQKQDSENPNLYVGKIGEEKVNFEVEFYTEENYIIWDVIQIVGQNRKVLFRLWFDSFPIQFNQKGIDTTLYKVIKYKPWYENEMDSVIDFRDTSEI